MSLKEMYNNLRRYNYQTMKQDTYDFIHFQGAFSTYSELLIKSQPKEGYFAIVQTGSAKGLYINMQNQWINIIDNAEDKESQSSFLGQYSLLFEVLTNAYYDYTTPENPILTSSNGYIQIIGYDTNSDNLDINQYSEGILYTQTSYVTFPVTTTVQFLNSQNKEFIGYYVKDDIYFSTIQSESVHKNRIQFIDINETDNKYYIYDVDQQTWVLIPQYGAFNEGWDINSQQTTFEDVFVPLFKIKTGTNSEITSNVEYLQKHIKDIFSFVSTKHNEQMQSINILDDKITAEVTEIKETYGFDKNIQLIGTIAYDTGKLYVTGITGGTYDTTKTQIQAFNNKDFLNIYSYNQIIDNKEFFVQQSNGIISELGVNENIDFGQNESFQQSDQYIYLLQMINGQWYYYNGDNFELLPARSYSGTIPEGVVDPRLKLIQKVKVENGAIAQLIKLTDFYEDKPYNSQSNVTITPDYISLKLTTVDPENPQRQVSPEIKIKNDGTILFDQDTVEIDGNAVINGTLTFGQMQDEIKKTRYELVLTDHTIEVSKNTISNVLNINNFNVYQYLKDKTTDLTQDNCTITVTEISNNGITYTIDNANKKISFDFTNIAQNAEFAITVTNAENFQYTKYFTVRYSTQEQVDDYKIVQLNGTQLMKDDVELEFKVLKKTGQSQLFLSDDATNIDNVYKLIYADDSTQVSHNATTKTHIVSNSEINGKRIIKLQIYINNSWVDLDSMALYDIKDPVANLIIVNTPDNLTANKKWNSTNNDYNNWDVNQVTGEIQFYYQGVQVYGTDLTINSQTYKEPDGTENALTLTFDSGTNTYKYSFAVNEAWETGVLTLNIDQTYAIPNTTNTQAQNDFTNISFYKEPMPLQTVSISNNNGIIFKTNYDNTNGGITDTTLTCSTTNIKNPFVQWRISGEMDYISDTWITDNGYTGKITLIDQNNLQIAWDYISDKEQVIIETKITGDNLQIPIIKNTTLVNIREYKQQELYFVVLEQETYMLDYDTTETIVTAKIYLKGVEITDFSDWSITFNPVGTQVTNGEGQVIPNQMKYNIDDVIGQQTIECTVDCTNQAILI